MNKKITAALIVISALLILIAGVTLNPSITYNYAEISLPSGKVVEGKVSSYYNEEIGKQVRFNIIFSNGRKYSVDSNNVVLSKK